MISAISNRKSEMPERALVESNRDLIARMEAKIKAKLDEILGEEETRQEPPDERKKLADSGPSR